MAANTQLNRVYVQTIDSTGTNDPTLRLGTKTLTTTVQVGGVGTVNSINVSSTGINVSGPLNASRVVLTNASMERLDVTGLTNLQNVSVKGVLDVVGKTTMGNVSTTALTATTLFATTINATGLTTLNNVSMKGAASVDGKLWANEMETPFMNVSTKATILNASINGTLDVTGKTTLNGALDVNGATNFYNTVTLSSGITVTGTVKTDTIEGSGSAVNMELGKGILDGKVKVAPAITTGEIRIGEVQTDGSLNIGQKAGRTGNINIGTDLAGDGAVNIGTNMGGSGKVNIGTSGKVINLNGTVNATGLTGFAKSGANTNTFSSLQTMTGGIAVTGATNINITGTETTTIGQSAGGTTALNSATTTVGGTLGVTGRTTLKNASMTGDVDINTTGSSTTTIGQTGGGTTALNSATTTAQALDALSVASNNFIAKTTTSNVSVLTNLTAGLAIGTNANAMSIGSTTLATNEIHIGKSTTTTFIDSDNVNMANVKTIGGTIGISWTTPVTVPQNYYDIAYNAGIFVSVGDNIQSVTTDGINFTTTTIPGSWRGITYAKGRFVAVGDKQMYSTNITGTTITWSTPTIIGGQFYKVAYGTDLGGRFVAVGDNCNAYSSDGITWTLPAQVTGIWRGLAYGNGRFIAVSYDNKVMMTSDSGAGAIWDTSKIISGLWHGIAYGNNRFVAVSDDGKQMYSTDYGVTWSTPTTFTGNFLEIVFTGDNFVSVGNNVQMVSKDGRIWTSTNIKGVWHGIAVGNNTIVAMGLLCVMVGTMSIVNTVTDPPTTYNGTNITRLITGNSVSSTSLGYNTTLTGPIGDEYTASKGTENTFGYLGTKQNTIVGQIYKIVFTVVAVSADTGFKVYINNDVMYDAGLLSTTLYKTHTAYFYATSSGQIYLVPYNGAAGTASNSLPASIKYKFISFDLVYGVTIQNSTKINGLLNTNMIKLEKPLILNVNSVDEILTTQGQQETIRYPVSGYSAAWNTTVTAYAPSPKLTVGATYALRVWWYSTSLPVGIANISVSLGASASAILDGQTTGLSEPYTFTLYQEVKNPQGGPSFSLTIVGFVTITSLYPYISPTISLQGTTVSNGATQFQITRIS
jgi:hypothetical protein